MGQACDVRSAPAWPRGPSCTTHCSPRARARNEGGPGLIRLVTTKRPSRSPDAGRILPTAGDMFTASKFSAGNWPPRTTCSLHSCAVSGVTASAGGPLPANCHNITGSVRGTTAPDASIHRRHFCSCRSRPDIALCTLLPPKTPQPRAWAPSPPFLSPPNRSHHPHPLLTEPLSIIPAQTQSVGSRPARPVPRPPLTHADRKKKSGKVTPKEGSNNPAEARSGALMPSSTRSEGSRDPNRRVPAPSSPPLPAACSCSLQRSALPGAPRPRPTGRSARRSALSSRLGLPCATRAGGPRVRHSRVQLIDLHVSSVGNTDVGIARKEWTDRERAKQGGG